MKTPSVSESGALPAIQAGSEISQSASATGPQQAMPTEEPLQPATDPQQATPAEESQQAPTDIQQALPADESQPLSADPQQVNRQIEEVAPIQSGKASVESSVVKTRVTKKGSVAIAEQGSITDLRRSSPKGSIST